MWQIILLTSAVTPAKQNLLGQFSVSHLKSTFITLLKTTSIFLGGFELEPKHRYDMKIQYFQHCVTLFVPPLTQLSHKYITWTWTLTTVTKHRPLDLLISLLPICLRTYQLQLASSPPLPSLRYIEPLPIRHACVRPSPPFLFSHHTGTNSKLG